jgi:hypothetical protein
MKANAPVRTASNSHWRSHSISIPLARRLVLCIPKMPTPSNGRRLPGKSRKNVPSEHAKPAATLRPLLRSRLTPQRRQVAFVPGVSGGSSSSRPQSGHAITKKSSHVADLAGVPTMRRSDAVAFEGLVTVRPRVGWRKA